MKRKIYNKILKWKEESNGKSALLIDGARRVGKSWIAEEFAKNNYKSYILIDFNKVKNEIIFPNYDFKKVYFSAIHQSHFYPHYRCGNILLCLIYDSPSRDYSAKPLFACLFFS